jgi:hypothetical protein
MTENGRTTPNTEWAWLCIHLKGTLSRSTEATMRMIALVKGSACTEMVAGMKACGKAIKGAVEGV